VVGRYNCLKNEQLAEMGLLPTLERVFAGEALQLPDTEFDPAQSGLPGQKRWVRTHMYHIKDDRGRIRNVVLLSEDITERKLAEMAVRESEERFRELAELLPEIVFELNEQGILTFVNRQAFEISGYSQEDFDRGFEAITLYVPEDRDRARRNVRALMKGEPSEGHEYIAQRKDGSTFPVIARSVPIVREGRPIGVRGVIFDISERTRAENEIRQLNEELEQRVLMRTAQLEAANQELEAFAYSVSHDLRAPLRAMDGFSHILLHEHASQLSADAQRYLHMVRESAQRMEHLIDSLLTFSRLGRQDLHKQTVSPEKLVDRVLRDLRAEQDEREVEVLVGDLPACQADPVLLLQVYANLLSNAFKFTRGRDRARIEVGCEEVAGQEVYYVRDNGVGFDMAYADKLFGVFQRLHSVQEYEGTGVGLATVQRIVRRHGGRVWAEAEEDAGATFYFTLG
jgi:PAS domain S-box-containing protein